MFETVHRIGISKWMVQVDVTDSVAFVPMSVRWWWEIYPDYLQRREGRLSRGFMTDSIVYVAVDDK